MRPRLRTIITRGLKTRSREHRVEVRRTLVRSSRASSARDQRVEIDPDYQLPQLPTSKELLDGRPNAVGERRAAAASCLRRSRMRSTIDGRKAAVGAVHAGEGAGGVEERLMRVR